MENMRKYIEINKSSIVLVREKDIRDYEKKYELKVELLNEIDYLIFLEEVKNKKKSLLKI